MGETARLVVLLLVMAGCHKSHHWSMSTGTRRTLSFHYDKNTYTFLITIPDDYRARDNLNSDPSHWWPDNEYRDKRPKLTITFRPTLNDAMDHLIGCRADDLEVLVMRERHAHRTITYCDTFYDIAGTLEQHEDIPISLSSAYPGWRLECSIDFLEKPTADDLSDAAALCNSIDGGRLVPSAPSPIPTVAP